MLLRNLNPLRIIHQKALLYARHHCFQITNQCNCDYYYLSYIFLTLIMIANNAKENRNKVRAPFGEFPFVFRRSANKNLKEYLENINADTLKDASRLTNESFGISWGFQADDTVMNRIDSGDLLFIKYDCSECLSADSMALCYLKTAFKLQHEFHGVAFAYRDQDGLQILHNQFNKTKCKNYCQFVSLPYLKELTLLKVDNLDKNAHLNLQKIINEEQFKDEDQLTFANRIASKIGILKRGALNSVDDLLQLKSTQINIRTQTNRTLRSL